MTTTTTPAATLTTDQILTSSGCYRIIEEALTLARWTDLHTAACFVAHRPSDDDGELCTYFGRLAIDTENHLDASTGATRGLVAVFDQLACYFWHRLEVARRPELAA